MNWCALFLWLSIAVPAVVFAGAIFGAVSNALSPYPHYRELSVVLGGGIMDAGLALSLVIMGSPLLVFVVASWALLGRHFPAIESNWFTLVLSVSAFAALVCGALLAIFPELKFGSPLFLPVLVLSALLVPRLATRRLRPGVFAV
jgi:hypothetical protein